MEKHLTLWEVQPRDPVYGLRTLTPIHDEERPSQTHGVLVYLFNSEQAARDFARDKPQAWTVEKREWAQSIFARCVKSGRARTPLPFTV